MGGAEGLKMEFNGLKINKDNLKDLSLYELENALDRANDNIKFAQENPEDIFAQSIANDSSYLKYFIKEEIKKRKD